MQLNTLSPKKLLHSKWTATQPKRKEKHFTIVEVEIDENANVIKCLMQAVMTKREFEIDWRDLKQTSSWLSGWK